MRGIALLPLLAKPEVQEVEESVSKLWQFFQSSVLPVLVEILVALVVYLVATKLIRALLKTLKRGLEKSHMELGVQTFLCSLTRILLYAILLFAIFDILGIASTTIVALLGSVGLTVGLALQGSLSNFAGGLLILVLKPFRVGDYIVACGEQGTVKEIDIFYTKLTTADNRIIVIPNGVLSNSNIVNVSNEPNRRVELSIPVAYDSDIRKVKELLYGLAEKDELVLKDQPINIYMDAFADSSINLGFRVWTKAESYWELKWRLMEEVKNAFDENGIEIPFNQLDVTINNK